MQRRGEMFGEQIPRVGIALIAAVIFLVGIVACVDAQGGALEQDNTQAAPPETHIDQQPAFGSLARSLEDEFNRVADEVLPVVVEINTVAVIKQNVPRLQSPWDYFFGSPGLGQQEFRQSGLGSGVIVRHTDRKVYVLTNNHVVGEADEISVRLYDGREYEASIVGMDPRTDLAMVAFDTRDDIPVARLGDSDALDVGDWVLAIGNPFGFESTVTVGIISALRRTPEPGSNVAAFTDYVQTDAAINPGNSGGALVNLNGEVIGINTWIASRSGGSVGLGFAVPVNTAKRVVDDFINRGSVSYGWLGVTIGDLKGDLWTELANDLGVANDAGVFVSGVVTDSPAERAGVLPGDFVVTIDDSKVDNAEAFTRIIGLRSAGSSVELGLIRDGRPASVSVVLGDRTDATDSSSTVWPGFMVTPLNDEIRGDLNLGALTRGVVVTSVDPQSVAAVAGIRPGDLVTAVNGDRIGSASEFYRKMGDAGDSVDLQLQRGGRTLGYRISKE